MNPSDCFFSRCSRTLRNGSGCSRRLRNRRFGVRVGSGARRQFEFLTGVAGIASSESGRHRPETVDTGFRGHRRGWLPILLAVFCPWPRLSSISGQIHATRPVLVRGSTPGSDRRCTRSHFVLFRERKVGSTGVARIRPIHIRAQDRLFGQKISVRNRPQRIQNGLQQRR